MDIKTVLEVPLGSPVMQCRALPVKLGSGNVDAVLAIYSADFDIDPWIEMFFFPTDTLKMALFDLQGKIIWRKDLGKGVVPGIWFCPVHVFDMDGDGVDEIYYVNNPNAQHPIGVTNYRLQRLDSRTGKETGDIPWSTRNMLEGLGGHRHFIAGGYAHGKPVLFAAVGTYHNMYLYGLNPDMSMRWEYSISEKDSGARGSHMLPIADINNDGIDEIMWGERAISLDNGKELFCCDRDLYSGHSDIIQPVYEKESGTWFIYTCRESDKGISPRIACFDRSGERVWGALEQGHIDIGWTAGAHEGKIACGIRIGNKTCGPEGRFHEKVETFFFDARTGKSMTPFFDAYKTIPVDLNGDGIHEFVRGQPGGDGEIFDSGGKRAGIINAPTAMACKFMNMPGEQLLAYYPDGTLRVWADMRAEDSDAALWRYRHSFYDVNRRMSACGYNLVNLGGV